MTRKLSPAVAGLAVLTALACGGVAWTGLSAIAAPDGLGAQVATLEADVQRIEQKAGGPRYASRHSPDDVCASVDESDLALVRQRLALAAEQSSLRLTDLVATPPADPSGYGRLTPVALRLQAIGPYESVIALLERLGEGRPQVFVEALDLTAAAPDVKLKLTGKVFCWTSAKS